VNQSVDEGNRILHDDEVYVVCIHTQWSVQRRQRPEISTAC